MTDNFCPILNHYMITSTLPKYILSRKATSWHILKTINNSPCVQFYMSCARCQCLGLHACMHCPCLGFSRWNHGMEVISHPIPLWTVIRCRQCAMDPKGLPSAYFRSFQRWDISNHHLVDVLATRATKSFLPMYILCKNRVFTCKKKKDVNS